MSAFQPGEIVDVVIKGVRVDEENADGTVTIVAEHPDGRPAHWQMPPQAAVTRVAPAEWPPRPGDLWKDRDGTLWFAVEEQGRPVGLMCDASQVWNPGEVGANWSPLTLVYREDDGEVSEP